MIQLTRQIFLVLGPALVAVSIWVAVNLDMGEALRPVLVYLNGLLFLAAGLVIVTTYRIWRHWANGIVTATGWLLLLLGAMRVLFPAGTQLDASPISFAVMVCLFLLGIRVF